jgi:hypothetical protein
MNVILTRKNLERARRPHGTNGNGHAPAASGRESGVIGAPGALPAPAASRPAAEAGTTPDDTLTRIIKLVPGEVIAGYTALLAVTASVQDSSVKWATPIALVACTLVVGLSLRRAGRSHEPPVEPQPAQYLFSILAFWSWALAIRDPLIGFGYYTPTWIPAFGCVLVPIFGAYVIDGEAPPASETP